MVQYYKSLQSNGCFDTVMGMHQRCSVMFMTYRDLINTAAACMTFLQWAESKTHDYIYANVYPTSNDASM